MERYGIGMMAKSLAGHDRGKLYLITGVDETFVCLSDGKIRTVEHPKRKKKKHVQLDRRIPEWIQSLLEEGRPIQDSDIIHVIKEYDKE